MSRFVNYCPGEYIDLKQNCNCDKPPQKPCKPEKRHPHQCDNIYDFFPFPPFNPCFPHKDNCDKHNNCDCEKPCKPNCERPYKNNTCYKKNNLMLFISGLLIGQMFNCDDDC